MSSTMVTCKISLGYDVSYANVEPLLKKGAEQVDLVQPVVQV